MYKQPFIPVKVYKWTSENENTLYTFNEENGNIKETIYQDDTIENALNKITAFITKENNVKFYAWVSNKSLLFTITNKKWRGFHINPFKSSDHNSNEINESISYEYHTNNLFMSSKINIVFAKDLPKHLQNNKYYFGDLQPRTYNHYKKSNDKLKIVKNLDSSNTKLLSEYVIATTLYSKVNNLILPDVFDHLNTSKHMEMIQWIDDTSKILYKLSKNNNIKKTDFNNWTNIDKITKLNLLIYTLYL